MKEKLNYIKKSLEKGIFEFKNGTKTMFKEFFNKDTNKKQRANMWTFIRLIIPFITIITSILAVLTAQPMFFLASGLIAGFGAVTDYYDGKSSRKHNSTSEYGKLLDQVADKIFAGIISINLLFINPAYIVVLLGELLIAAINVGYKVKYNNLDIKSTMAGKIKEWPLFITLALGFLSPINSVLFTASNISIILTSLFQLATAVSYVENNNKEAKKLKTNLENIKIDVVEEENENEKELVLTKTKQSEQLEQYKNLRNVLTEILDAKQKQVEPLEENYQKIKEL